MDAPTKQKPAPSEEKCRELMRRAQSGDNQAYEELLIELDTFLKKYCMGIIKNWSDAGNYFEDLSQDCLIAIHKARETYNPDKAFFPWAKSIVRNKSIDWMRKEVKKVARYESNEKEVNFSDQNASNQQIDNKLIIDTFIKKIDDKYQQAIILTKLHGYTEKEAAKKLNLTTSTVKIRVYRGLKALKQVVEDDLKQNQKSLQFLATIFIFISYMEAR